MRHRHLVGGLVTALLLMTPNVSLAEDEVSEVEADSVVVGLADVDFEVEIQLEAEAAVAEESEAECNSKEKPCESKTEDGETTAKVKSKRGSRSLFSFFFSSVDEVEEENDDADFPATHRQVALLKVSAEGDNAPSQSGLAVHSFCLDQEDNLLVALTEGGEGKLQLLDAEGKHLQTIDLPVLPEAVNIDAEGNYLVAGAGNMYRLSPEGEVLLEASSPLVKQLEEQREEIREQVIQQIKDQAQMMVQQKEVYQQQIDNVVKAAANRLDRDDRREYQLLKDRVDKLSSDELAKLDAQEQNAWALRKVLLRMLDTKVEALLTEQEKETRKLYADQMQYFEQYAEVQAGAEPSDKQVDETLASMIQYKSKIASISATTDEVFIATGAVTGYGYDVWRFDAAMENPEKIVTQLRGCCGQMDVQACESGLYVAENSRHKVQHFDLKGDKVNSWGEGDRESVRGFGSCCNPMNVAFGADGSVYTAESGSGRIKRYSDEGELLSLVGSVELVPGCKKVSIAVTKDHQRVYMLDITRNHIIVMEAKSEKQQVASKDEVEAAS